MKTTLIACSIAIAAMFASTAHAQGEVGDVPKQQKRVKPTPDQRAAGKAQRRAEGREAAHTDTPGETGPTPTAGPTQHYSKGERVAARKTRRADTARANKAGEIPVEGEVGPKP